MVRVLGVVLCMFFLVSLVSASLYYQIDVRVEGDNLEITDQKVIYSRLEKSNGIGDDFNIRVFEGNNILFEENIEREGYGYVFVENFDTQESTLNYEEDYDLVLFVPYFEEATSVVVVDPTGEVLDEKVIVESKGKDDLILAQASTKRVDAKKEGGYWWVLILLLLIVIALVIYYAYYKKNK